MQDCGVGADAEAGEDLVLDGRDGGVEQGVGLRAVGGYYHVVVGVDSAVREVQLHASGGGVGYALHGGREEDVVRGEAFHYGVDVGLSAVLER